MQKQGKRAIMIRRVMMCLLACMFVVNIYADDFVRVAVKGGATSDPAYDTLSIGRAVGVEVAYRKQNYSGWFIDVGLGLNSATLNNYRPDSVSSEQRTDYQGDAFLVNQQFGKLRNRYNSISFVLPVMGGYEYERFYAMAGVQLKGIVLNRAQTRGFITETFEYDNLIDALPNKAYDLYGDMHKVSPSLDVQVSAEIGVQLTRDRRIPSRKAHMAIKNAYLSAFVDYTVFSTRPIMPLTAGVKLSCLLQVKKYKCICLKNVQKKRRR